MTWRQKSLSVIGEVMAENPGLTGAELRREISENYPFGERSGFPYKAWLKAVEQVLGPSQKKIESTLKKREEMRLKQESNPVDSYQPELPEVCK